MSWNQSGIKKLKLCFSQIPSQGQVGQPPSNYLAILRTETTHLPQSCDGAATAPVESNYPHVSRKCSRSEIRDICRDSHVDVLEAYGAAMAWGGQHRRWFRSSLKKPLLLRRLLCDLRASKATRSRDFGSAKQASASIIGLGISFYTKLLYFFRSDPDAYILDQWTAKSIHLLTGNIVRLAPWGGPDPNTTPNEYKGFCKELEALGVLLGGWSGDTAEQAVFDKPGGCWRTWLRTQWPTSTGQKRPTANRARKSLPAQVSDLIEEFHSQVAENGIALPPGDPTGRIHKNGNVQLRAGQGVEWLYRVQIKGVVCQVNFLREPGGAILANLIQANNGSPVFPNGAVAHENKTVSSISLKPQLPSSKPWDVAEAAVDGMSMLWDVVHSTATAARISHPHL